MKIIILSVIILLSSSVSAKQKYYKWTDENGNTHYTSEKPENVKTDEINVNTNQPKAAQAIEVGKNPQPATQEQGNKDDAVPEKTYLEQRREKKQKAKETADKNRRQCQKARNTVKKYQQQVRMSRFDSKTGEKVYLEDSKRDEIINSAQQAVRKYCN